MSLSKVEGDESLFLASEDEVMDMEHLLAEPKCNEELIDSVLGFEKFHQQACFNIEEFSCGVEYDQLKIGSDSLEYDLPQEEEKTRLEFLDGELLGTCSGTLHGTNSFSSNCEDFLLDSETTDKVHNLDHGPSEESCLGNLGLGGRSPSFHGGECGAEVSEMSSASILRLESRCDQNLASVDKMTIHELHEAFRNVFGHDPSVTEQELKCPISLGSGNLGELDNGLSLLDCGATSCENGGKLHYSCSGEFSENACSLFRGVSSNLSLLGDEQVKKGRQSYQSLGIISSDVCTEEFGVSDSGGKGVFVTQKRLRKPTRRYIEESLDQKLRHRKCGNSYKTSKEKLMHGRFHKRHMQKAFGEQQSVNHDESFTGACIQVPFGPPVQKGRPKKKLSFLGHEPENCKDNKILDENSSMETSHAESQDDRSDDDSISRINTKKGKTRRKNHRLWTLSEVMKLIDGVSQYGVGRWTEIKRLLFSSSAHRTSVDLKDKWRNLLRASCAKLQSRREVEHRQKHVSHQIPQTVLCRVRELALMYPYPRERKSKVQGARGLCLRGVKNSMHSQLCW